MTTPLDRLEAVLAARTGGDGSRWVRTETRGKRDGYIRGGHLGSLQTVADMRYRNGEADARAITAAVNLAPSLLAVVKAAAAYHDAANGGHMPWNLHVALDDSLRALHSAITQEVGE